jgi:pSer/pThr/pTyr-binding forkhead associated (FHA) protein
MELRQSLETWPKLILASPKAKGKLVALVRARALIGREAGNDLVLDSGLVSRRHAVVQTDGLLVTLQDLGSRNGTFVNGRRIQSRVLAHRDIIEIGDYILRFHAASAASTPPAALA